MDKYKFISLGNHCGVKQSLKIMNISQETYPFDYVVTDNENEFINIIANKNFENWLNFESYSIHSSHHNGLILHKMLPNEFLGIVKLLKFHKDLSEQMEELIKINDFVNFTLLLKKYSVPELIIKSLFEYLINNTKIRLLKNDMMFVHDHSPNNKSWNDVKEKYIRRINRFYELDKQEKEIIFIRSYFSSSEPNYKLFKSTLDEYFHKYKILFIVNNNKNSDFIKLDDNIFVIRYNIKDPYNMSLIILNFIQYLEK